jgi:hypothetical protein
MDPQKKIKLATAKLNQAIDQCEHTKNLCKYALALLGECGSSPNSPKGKILKDSVIAKRRLSLSKKSLVCQQN